ncbi:hypothetical protein D3C73_1254900 [compost metagenome]
MFTQCAGLYGDIGNRHVILARVVHDQQAFSGTLGQAPRELAGSQIGIVAQAGRSKEHLDALPHRQLQGVFGLGGLRDFLHVQPHHRFAVVRHARTFVDDAQDLLFIAADANQWRRDSERHVGAIAFFGVDP